MYKPITKFTCFEEKNTSWINITNFEGKKYYMDKKYTSSEVDT